MKKRYILVTAACVAIMIPAAPASADPSPEEVQADIDERNSELEHVIEEYNAAQEQLEDADERIAEIKDKLPDLEADVAAASEEASTLATAAYANGNFNTATALLTGTPEEVADRMAMMDALSDLQQAELESYVEAVEELEAEQAELETLVESQDQLASEMAETKEDIEGEIAELEDLLAEVTPPPANESADGLPEPSGDAAAVVQYAYDQLGDPYEWGAAGPNSFDCSGLTQQAWAQAGVSLPHNAAAQWDSVPHISRDALAPGDLVFYNDLGHVGLYVGDGQIIHAPSTGRNVEVASVDTMPPYGYGRPG